MANDQYSRIWRTVVFAGAMLGTPGAALAGDAASKPAPPPATGTPSKPATGPAVAPPVKADPAVEKQAKIKELDGERTALLGKLAEVEVKDIDQLKKDIVAKDTAIKKLVEEIVNLRKPRPRTPVSAKPVGRGFVLA